MTWKKLILILLILAGLAAVPYYFYQSGQMLQWQEQILTELERALDAEMTVSEISLLPLNRISLREVKIQREEDLDLYLAEVDLYYDLRNLLEIFWRDRLETDLAEALLANLHQIRISEPELEIWNPEGEIFSELDFEDEVTLPDPAPLWRELPPLPAGAGLVVQGGSISYQERESGFFFELDRLEVKAREAAGLSAGIRGDLRLVGLEISEGNGFASQLSGLSQLSRIDLAGLEAGLTLEQDSWELRAEATMPDLSQLEEAGRELAREYGLRDLAVTGSQQLQLTALGSRDELEDFQVSGLTELSEVSFLSERAEVPIDREGEAGFNPEGAAEGDESGFSREETAGSETVGEDEGGFSSADLNEVAEAAGGDEGGFFRGENGETVVLEDVSWQTNYSRSGGRLVISDLTFSFLENIFSGEGSVQLAGTEEFQGFAGFNFEDNSGESSGENYGGNSRESSEDNYGENYDENYGEDRNFAGEREAEEETEGETGVDEETGAEAEAGRDVEGAAEGDDFSREDYSAVDYYFEISGSEIDLAELKEYFRLEFPAEIAEIEEDISPWSPGRADFNLAVTSGVASGPALALEMELVDSRIKDQSFGAKLKGRWQEERFWLDELEVVEAEERGLARLRGDYDLAGAGYNFQLDLEKLEAGLLLDLLPERFEIPEFQGDLQASLTGSGQGFSAADPDVSGEVSLTDFYYQDREGLFGPDFRDFSAPEVRADFWLAEGLLELGPARADTELGGLELGGVELGGLELGGHLDLVSREMDLRLETEELDLKEMARLVGIEEDFTGRARLAGRLTGTFASPGISAALEIPEAEIFGVDVREGYGNFFYFADRDLVSIRGLDFISRGSSVRGRGDFYLAGDGPEREMEARLDIEELTYEYINEIFDIALPLEGDVSGKVEINGTFDDLEVVSEATSRSTSLPLGDQVFTFANARSSFYWRTGEPFQVRHLTMEKEQAVFYMNGDFAEEFQADFSFRDYPLEKLDFEDLEGLAGLASGSGRAAGSYDNPGGEGNIEIQGLSWQGEDLGSLTGYLGYEDERLTVSQADWQPGPGEYSLSGSISSLLSDPLLDLRLEMAEVELDYYLERFEVESPLDLNYLFGGELNLRGRPAEPEAEIDLTAECSAGEMGRIELAGRIGQEYDVSLEGENVRLDWLSAFFEEEIDFSGELEFEGSLSGPLREPDFELRTLASNIGIGPYRIREVSGRASLSRGEILTLDQELIAEPGRELNLTARLPWQDPAEAELDLRARDFPLDPLAGFFPGIQELAGSLAGQVNLSGFSLDKLEMEELETEGELAVIVERADFGQEQALDLDGRLIFRGQRAELEDFLARIDGEEVVFSGGLNLADFDNFWDLRADAADLSLVLWGSSGDLTGNLSMTGPLFSPLTAGEITLNNLIAVVPEEVDFQEMAAVEPGPEEESSFRPRFDVRVAVGSNNYFQHDNADILIQRGEVRLLYAGDFEIDGQLSSNQGSVYFYNNRFSLETARLDFGRRRGFIPRVAVRARTTVDGDEITVNLDGPADNMRTSFASTPPMEEEEIISQLIGRGGLGGVLAGQQLTIPQVAQHEFMRIVSERLEFNILANLSAHIRRALELDRFELVSEGGLIADQEMTLYMGKELGDRLYLETESRFGFDERDTSVSFRYFFTERTFLEGTFDAIDDYSISIETEIEF